LPYVRASLVLMLAFAPAMSLSAQATPIASSSDIVPGKPSAAATTNDEGPAGIIPFVKGPNVSFATTSQHDSSDGWSTILTPDFAWRFNRAFSADASIPIFGYINILATGGTKAKPVYTQETKHFIVGDTALNGHFEIDPDLFTYALTASLGLPSGNTAYGLGAGQVTYNFNNHLEHSFDWFTPDIELGIGDNSALVGARVLKSYLSVGTLAHFQAGASVDLPLHMDFEADAYEELPVAAQTLYSTTGKGRKKKTVATNSGIAEDNGFTNSLDIPLSGHVTLSGFYNRSLRSHIDTAGFTLTFLLKAPPKDVPR
jgi:hypothetical protein